MAKKTREEIDKLKLEWINDPIWDIEETEGFEDHKQELLIFHLEKRLEWKEQNQKRAEKLAQRLGTGSPKLARYIMNLENRVEALETKVDNLQINK